MLAPSLIVTALMHRFIALTNFVSPLLQHQDTLACSFRTDASIDVNVHSIHKHCNSSLAKGHSISQHVYRVSE